jgi:hypothetical protein
MAPKITGQRTISNWSNSPDGSDCAARIGIAGQLFGSPRSGDHRMIT